MKFPGTNKLSLSHESVEALIAEKLSAQFGNAVRVTDISMNSYGTEMTVRFTSDPAEPPASAE